MKIILIAGPSGAGKDSLLRECARNLTHRRDILFMPRYVTRMPDASEHNYYIDRTAFEILKQNGFFFIDWEAHGHLYGIGLEQLLKKDLAAVIISVSRTVIPAFEQVFNNVDTILVTAPETVLRKRLEDRGRESAGARDSRLARFDLATIAARLIRFSNDSPLEKTSVRFTELMTSLLPAAPGSSQQTAVTQNSRGDIGGL